MPDTLTSQTDDERSTLLLVDDDEAFRRVLARALERRGFAVTVANNVSAALAKVQALAPEYAVVDLKMPGESGLVLIEKLIELDPNTRVVMLTTWPNPVTPIRLSRRSTRAATVIRRLPSPARRCPSIGSNGNTFSVSSPSRTATYRRLPEPSRCTAARCSASSASIRRASSDARRIAPAGSDAHRQMAIGSAFPSHARPRRPGRHCRSCPARRRCRQTGTPQALHQPGMRRRAQQPRPPRTVHGAREAIARPRQVPQLAQ